MKRRDIASVALGLVSFVALSVYTATHLRVSTDITHFLPSSDDRKLADISKRLTDSTATRMMILSIQAPSLDRALDGAAQLAEELRKQPEVASCQTGPDARLGESTYQLLFPHRFQLYSDRPEQDVPKLLSDAGLAQAASRLKTQLAMPTAAMVSRIAAADPLLLFPSIVKRLAAAGAGSLEVVNGRFVSADRGHAILFVETKHSPFDGATQRPFLAFLQQAFERVNRAQGGVLKLQESGVNRFAVDSERSIRADINRISTFSTVAVIVLFLLLFRSIRVLVLSFIPLFYGLAAATAANLALFGEVHGLTLAFGSTLIGVCVDFPIHFLNHHSLEPDPAGPYSSLGRILGALVLGAVTTIAGFAGLAWTAFPGMRELAIFASVGIVAALVSTCWLLPPLSAHSPKRVRLHLALADFLGRLLGAMVQRRSLALGLGATALLLCVAGLPRVRWSDDLSTLNRVNERLLAEDEQVRAQVSRMDAGRFIIVTGEDAGQALERNDLVFEQLVAAKAAGEVDGFSSLHEVLFSPALQRRNLEAFRRDPLLGNRVAQAFAREGFRPEALGALSRSLATAPTEPVTLAEVLHSPLGQLIRPFTVELGKEVGVITLVRGGQQPAALKARIEQVPGAHYFDQNAFLAQAYGRYRVRTIELVGVGILVMFLVIFAKYRRIRPTIAAGLPAVLASVTTLALLGLLGLEANLLHVVALVLVLSTGEDYAVFLLASAKDPPGLRASAVSVVLCCLSTVLGFGLLGFSKMPALAALGLTTGIGILLCMILAPVALVIAPEGSEG